MTRDQFSGVDVSRLIEEARASGWNQGYIAGLEYARRMIAARADALDRPRAEESEGVRP
jgi:hypothetical protein